MSGFEVRNAAGGLVLTDDTSPLVFKAKWTLPIHNLYAGGGAVNTAVFRDFELNMPGPIFAYRVGGSPASPYHMARFYGKRIEVVASLPSAAGFPDNYVIQVGSTYYRKISGSWASVSSGSVSVTTDAHVFVYLFPTAGFNTLAQPVTLYQFDILSNAEAAPSSFAGLETYDPSGRLTFSSRYKAIQVVASARYQGPSNTVSLPITLGTIANYDPSRTYAIYFAPPNTSRRVTAGGTLIQPAWGTVRLNGAVIEGDLLLLVAQPGASLSDRVTYDVLVVDVTDL